MKKYNVYNGNDDSHTVISETATQALIKLSKKLELDYEALQEFNDGMQCLIGKNGGHSWVNYYATEAGDND